MTHRIFAISLAILGLAGCGDASALPDQAADLPGARIAGAPVTCPDAEQLDVLGAYVDDVVLNGSLIAGHGGASEAVGTLPLPGWNVAQGSFFFLFQPCSGPVLYDEWCDGEVCWQTECIGGGASWTQHATLDRAPRTRNAWSYGSGFTDVTWIEGGQRLRLSMGGDAVDPAGQDYRFRAVARVDPGQVDVAMGFPRLLGGGQLLRAMGRFNTLSGDFSGVMQVDRQEVATLVDGPSGFEWVPSGACF